MGKIEASMKEFRKTGEKTSLEDALVFYEKAVDKIWKGIIVKGSISLKNLLENNYVDILESDENSFENVMKDLTYVGDTYTQLSDMLRFCYNARNHPKLFEAYMKKIDDKLVYCIFDLKEERDNKKEERDNKKEKNLENTLYT